MKAASSSKVSSIRVTTKIRSSQHPDGSTVSVEVLKPLTPAEKKAGKKDTFKAWVRAYGDGSSKKSARGRYPSDWWDQKPKREKPHASIDEAIQLEISKVMEKDFERMAVKLVSQSHIAVSDKEFFKALMFDACRDAYPKFDPNKRSLRGFMKDIIKKWRSDYRDFLNSGKRKEDFTRMSIGQHSVADENVQTDDSASAMDGGISTSFVSEEELPDPHTLHVHEFNLAWSDLEELCDPDEKLALHVLYSGGTVEEIAGKLKLNPASARRNVVGSLQLKVDFCFGFSQNHQLKFILEKK